MTSQGYPPSSMSPHVHDNVAVYIQLNRLRRRLAGLGPPESHHPRRAALLQRLVDAQHRLDRSGMWN